MGGDMGHREVVVQEGEREAAEGEGDEHELGLRGRSCGPNPGRVTALRADDRQGALHQRHEQREDQGEVAEFGCHFASFAACAALFATSTACCASGGM